MYAHVGLSHNEGDRMTRHQQDNCRPSSDRSCAQTLQYAYHICRNVYKRTNKYSKSLFFE